MCEAEYWINDQSELRKRAKESKELRIETQSCRITIAAEENREACVLAQRSPTARAFALRSRCEASKIQMNADHRLGLGKKKILLIITETN